MSRTVEVRAGSALIAVDDDEGGPRPVLVVGPWMVGPIPGWRVFTMKTVDAAFELAVADIGSAVAGLGLDDVVVIGGWPVAAYASRAGGVRAVVLVDEPAPEGLDGDAVLATIPCPVTRVARAETGLVRPFLDSIEPI